MKDCGKYREKWFRNFWHRYRWRTKRLSFDDGLERRLLASGCVLEFNHRTRRVRLLYPGGEALEIPTFAGLLPMEARN